MLEQMRDLCRQLGRGDEVVRVVDAEQLAAGSREAAVARRPRPLVLLFDQADRWKRASYLRARVG